HTRFSRDWSSDVCSSDLDAPGHVRAQVHGVTGEVARVESLRRASRDKFALPGLRAPSLDDREVAVSQADGALHDAHQIAVHADEIGRASCRERGWVWLVY